MADVNRLDVSDHNSHSMSHARRAMGKYAMMSSFLLWTMKEAVSVKLHGISLNVDP